MDDNKEYKKSEHKVVSVLAATAAGGALGALVHNEEAQKQAIDKLVQSSDIIEKVRKIHGESALRELFKDVKYRDILKAGWDSLGRAGKATLGAIALGMTAVIVNKTVGYFRGAKKADEGLRQFKEITAENRQLRQQLEVSEQKIAEIQAAVATPEEKTQNGFAYRLDKEREQSAKEKSERSYSHV